MADSSDPDARARATRTLRRLTAAYRASMTTLRRVGIREDPFRSLVATVISQRSRDAQTDPAAPVKGVRPIAGDDQGQNGDQRKNDHAGRKHGSRVDQAFEEIAIHAGARTDVNKTGC